MKKKTSMSDDLKYNKKEGQYWFVWVKKNGENQIIPSTISPSEKFVKKQLSNFISQKPELVFGLGNSAVIFSDITYIKNYNPYEMEIMDCPNFIVLDCETTGSSRRDEVIDVGAVLVENYEIVSEYQSFINNTVPITYHSKRVHGLSQKFIDKNGRDAFSVFSELRDFIGDLMIVGHGVSYDKRMIEQHSERVGVPIHVDILYDTSKISKKVLDMPNHKLEDILDRFSLREGLKSHGALDDAKGTQRFAKKIYNIYKNGIK